MSPSSLIGKIAPTFILKNHDNTDYEFKAEGGTPTAIFFYPKSGRWLNSCSFEQSDDTLGSFGCTREACQFRDALVGRCLFALLIRTRMLTPDFADNDAFKGSNLRVIGISPDSVQEQDTFVKNQKLTVSLPNAQRPTVGSDPRGPQYPVLSDSSGEFRKLYGVGKGILGLVDARVTYFVDSKGVVR